MIIWLAAGLSWALLRGSTVLSTLYISSPLIPMTALWAQTYWWPLHRWRNWGSGSTISLRSQWQDYDSNPHLLKSSALESFRHRYIITRSQMGLFLKIIDTCKIQSWWPTWSTSWLLAFLPKDKMKRMECYSVCFSNCGCFLEKVGGKRLEKSIVIKS